MRIPRKCLWVLILAGGIPGCGAFNRKPPVYDAPKATVAISQFAGTALSGALPQGISQASMAAPWAVSVRVVALQKLPQAKELEPISLHARLVIGQDAATLFAPSSRLIYSTQAVTLEADQSGETLLGLATQRTEMRQLRGAVVPGSTASFAIALPDDAPETPLLSRRRITVAVDRSANTDSYELVLISDDLLLPQNGVGQEKVVLQRDISKGNDHLMLVVPMAFADGKTAGLAIDLSVDTQAADAQTVTAMQQDIALSSREAAARMKVTLASPKDAAISAALTALASKHSPRGTLAYLADETGAKLTSSVIMAADDRTLELITTEVKSAIAALPSRDRATVSWMLDRAALKAIGAIKPEDAQASLTPIMGALSVFAGESGRQLDALQSLAAQSAGSDDLYARITAEQYIALEDNSPAVRVRACDWLAAHAVAPAGYDPLGAPRERRAALEKFNEATTPPAVKASIK